MVFMTFTSWGIEGSFPASTSAPNLREDVNGGEIHSPTPSPEYPPKQSHFYQYSKYDCEKQYDIRHFKVPCCKA
jgi:hypothetical protein